MLAGDMTPRAAIVGLLGTALSDDERAVFARTPPLGVILFKRNIDQPEQVRQLIRQVRASLGRPDAPVLIDQEGGRVQRLRPPHWPDYPSLRAIGRLAEREANAGHAAAYAHARLIAADLDALGIDVVCAPCLDLLLPQTHRVIGDRAFAADPTLVASLGQTYLRGLHEGGVLGVIKHIPGHGRARGDSHLQLPSVTADAAQLAQDWRPFVACAQAAPFAMTAHIRYAALDPYRPATLSPVVIARIRQEIGFAGALLSDDLFMAALEGPLAARTVAAIDAGCDAVVYGNGLHADLTATAEVLQAAQPIAGQASRRIAAALGAKRAPTTFDHAQARARIAALSAQDVA